ncbi:MAG: hypothetical protein HYU28_12220 [Actinobacteria bacterium]|nr:hypothetical protein [Actinomycetota bacterium]
MTEAPALPKVTPYLIERAEDLCPRRLRLAFQNQKGDGGAFLRGRVRDALIEDARAAHAELGPPNPASFHVRTELLPEEQAVQRRAIDHYLAIFGDEPVRAIDHDDFDRPVERQGVLVGGWIDLACEGPDGEPELRQFELWGRPMFAEPADNMTILLAVLRLSRWVGDRALRIRLADLVGGRVVESTVPAPARAQLVDLYEQRIATITGRTRRAEAIAGDHCTACPYVPGCPAFR